MSCPSWQCNGIELEAVGLQFEPYRWRPCGVTWDSSRTVVVIKLRRTSALLLSGNSQQNLCNGQSSSFTEIVPQVSCFKFRKYCSLCAVEAFVEECCFTTDAFGAEHAFEKQVARQTQTSEELETGSKHRCCQIPLSW